MPSVFPDYPAPVIRNAGDGRQMTLMRWGMPPPLRVGGPPVTKIRNSTSPQWRGWLKPENRCLVPIQHGEFYELTEKDQPSRASEGAERTNPKVDGRSTTAAGPMSNRNEFAA